MALTATASGEPTSSAVLDGRRVRFRPVAALRTEESWVDRPVRSPPCYPEWTSGASCLAYYENYRPAANFGRALQNSNLVQVILRDHGYDKVEAFEDEAWSIFWCSGPAKPEQLALLRPWQRINKFPASTALTSKLALWSNFARMQTEHGRDAYGFVSDCFVLPNSLLAYEEHLRARLAEGEKDLWILKPDDENSSSKAKSNGIGIFLHRAEPDTVWNMVGGRGVLTDAVRQHCGVACRYAECPSSQEATSREVTGLLASILAIGVTLHPPRPPAQSRLDAHQVRRPSHAHGWL